MTRGFHHIGLKTADIDKSLAFYAAIGGKELYHFTMPSGRTIYMISLGEKSVIEIIPGKEGEAAPAAGWVHIALDTDNCDAAFDAAVAAGAAVQSAPEDKQLGESGIFRLAFVEGPDGEVIEFSQKK